MPGLMQALEMSGGKFFVPLFQKARGLRELLVFSFLTTAYKSYVGILEGIFVVTVLDPRSWNNP